MQNVRRYEELKNLAREKGFELGDLSAEQAQRTIGVVTGRITDELTDDELALVAGGTTIPRRVVGFSDPWDGRWSFV